MSSQPRNQDASVVASYALMEARLREIIDAPHWKVRRGEVALDASGQPIPDPRPAQRARRLLAQVQRDRKRITGR